MIHSDYNLNPVIEVRPRWSWCMRSSFGKEMKNSILTCALLSTMLSQPASAGLSSYFTSYCLHREFAAQHAPAAASRTLIASLRGEALVVEIKHGRIMWMRPVPDTKTAKLKVKFLEPVFYYFFMPLVEFDCALNGHPLCRDHNWRFFGRNAEFEPIQ